MSISEYDKKNFERIMYGEGDWFGAMLIRLFAKADLHNRRCLAKGFPEVAAAFEEWNKTGKVTNAYDTKVEEQVDHAMKNWPKKEVK